jgi:hypothetical protein
MADWQTLQAICSPLLYRDCQVSDPSRFIQTAASDRKLLSKVRTLRIYDSLRITDPSIIELLLSRAEWSQVGPMRHSVDKAHEADVRRRLQMRKHHQLPNHANTVRLSIQQGNWLFPNLKKVAMTSIGDCSWGRMRQDNTLDCVLGDNRLPLSLLSLPSVEHYCQTSAVGPLSLSSDVVRPLHPPKIVTSHYALRETPWPYHTFEPIVLGAINRYIYCASSRVGTPYPLTADLITSESSSMLDVIAVPLMTRHTVIQEIESTSRDIDKACIPFTKEVPFDKVSLEGTYIEVYNVFRNFEDNETISDEDSKHAKSWPFAPDVCEALEKLGDGIWGRWKGRVKIRNKEDIPDCPACGYSGHRTVGVDPF